MHKAMGRKSQPSPIKKSGVPHFLGDRLGDYILCRFIGFRRPTGKGNQKRESIMALSKVTIPMVVKFHPYPTQEILEMEYLISLGAIYATLGIYRLGGAGDYERLMGAIRARSREVELYL